MAREWPPARAGQSIYEFVAAHLDADGRLTPEGQALPDETRVMTGELRWAPGAMEGAFGHHGGGGQETSRRAIDIGDLLLSASKTPSNRRLRHLYDAVCEDNALEVIDRVIERLIEMKADQAGLHQVGRWLAVSSVDRGAVKTGIALLGASDLGNDLEVVRVLGRHEEFTLYAAVALTNGLPDAQSELWALAKSVEGWGRIHCVERLAGTADPQIREWILREGFKNSVMYEYLAYTAATTGNLNGALRRDHVDRALLTAAGEIIAALITGGPAKDIDDYADGADAVEAYLALMLSRAESLDDFLTLTTIRRFLAQGENWDDRATRGWTATRRKAFEAQCDRILSRDEWDDRIRVALLSEDHMEFNRADAAARDRGIDTFDLQVARIRQDPLLGPWFRAWQQADRDRAGLLASMARELLPLEAIPTGPAKALGVGPEWRAHAALDWSLQALRDHPGVGPDLVLVGLQSPVTRNRNMSLNVLKKWPREQWPEGARLLVDRLATADPNQRTQDLASEILADGLSL
jgi:hypothetical protein